MEHVALTKDLSLSRVALGFWRWKEWGISIEELDRLVHQTLDLGITTYDHANIYDEGNPETAFGQVLSRNPGLRDQIQIITKSTIIYKSATARVKYYNSTYDHIVSEVEKSLQRLQTDHSDLHLLHRPDPFMDPAEVARAFADLQKAGKVRHFGVSNYTPDYFDMLSKFVEEPLVTNQIEVSVLQHDNFDNGAIVSAQKYQIHPMVWSPLAGGRIFVGEDEQAVRVRKELQIVAEELGTDSIDEVAFAWLFSHPVGFVPITGSCEMEYIERPVNALKYRLNQEQWFAIWSAYTGRRVP